ncbi:hypothetical protein FOQG_12857 [Fusarium oxysporum f. sp. raphani 54005]|uniref:Uncharacterized protein n=2 Tax=Fusarium oxysporum TaxID=5507 RepID=X0CK14_FUSOX|nr:hypothetical protein FOVG_15432 [Fusarium oxysporum f. sp. pisi HDV247]EXK82897.1 hypothetical protein FOQG_12857 [Fusarium oxysporum f. sp. raphani 54005]
MPPQVQCKSYSNSLSGKRSRQGWRDLWSWSVRWVRRG